MSGAGFSHNPVWQAARLGDRDRYFAALLAAEPERGWMMALAAFNGDMRRIADTLSEPQLAQIRLQWWRETLASLKAGERVGSPIADALAAGIADRPQAAAMLEGLVEARQFDIEGGVMADQAELGSYLQKTDGALFSLATERRDDGGARAAADAGLAYGLTRIMCALPFDLARGRLFVPRDLLGRHGVDPEQLLGEGHAPGLAGALADLSARVRGALSRAREVIAAGDGAAPRAFLPLVLVEADLKALERAGTTPKKTPIGLGPPWRIARIAWAGLTNRI